MEEKNKKLSLFLAGYDFLERAATNVLIDSLYQNTNHPVNYPIVKINY